MTPLSRRGVLAAGIGVAGLAVAGGVGYALVEDGVLPGKYQLARTLGACGADPGVPDMAAGPTVTETFRSRYRKRDVEMIVMRPPGRYGSLPVVLVLHGAGGAAASAVQLGYPQYLAALVTGGKSSQFAAGGKAQPLATADQTSPSAADGQVPPFAAVAVDGGGSSYWHPRADGDDPLGMIVSEVLPRLARQGYQVDKIGLAGWSTGGYGALLLAERLERGQVEPGQVEPGQVTPGQVTPGRVAAVAVSSPAIFASYADAHAANAGSFDGAADFAANDVQSPAGLAALKRIPVMIDCGSSDPFAAQDTLLRSHLGTPPGAISRGCHDQAFWRRHLPAELAFLGAHLTA